MTDEQMNNPTKEQAIRLLHPDTQVDACGDYEEAGNYEQAFNCACLMAIAALRDKSDSVTIKLPDNGMCAIVRKVNGRYEVDTGWVEKWPETAGVEGTKTPEEDV